MTWIEPCPCAIQVTHRRPFGWSLAQHGHPSKQYKKNEQHVEKCKIWSFFPHSKKKKNERGRKKKNDTRVGEKKCNFSFINSHADIPWVIFRWTDRNSSNYICRKPPQTETKKGKKQQHFFFFFFFMCQKIQKKVWTSVPCFSSHHFISFHFIFFEMNEYSTWKEKVKSIKRSIPRYEQHFSFFIPMNHTMYRNEKYEWASSCRLHEK